LGLTGRTRYVSRWDLEHIATVRHAVTEFAAWHGLRDRQQADFVLAVNELVSNAVQHGGGSGAVRLWRTAAAVWCEVSDGGPGLPADRRDGHPAAAPRTPPAAGGCGWCTGCATTSRSPPERAGRGVRVVKNLTGP